MGAQDWVLIIGAVAAFVSPLVALYFKDKADSRRWEDAIERASRRHSENTQKLDVIEGQVNGKMQQLVEKTGEAEFSRGLRKGKEGG